MPEIPCLELYLHAHVIEILFLVWFTCIIKYELFTVFITNKFKLHQKGIYNTKKKPND
jgi:hypothetical protein